jgi:hypothetical protein
MKPLFYFLIFFYFPILCFGQVDSGYFEMSVIQKCWTNSREEANQTSTFIYRPCDYKTFPPSRFRDRIEFEENGKCSYLYLAPTDGHYMVQGEWTYDKSKQVITIKDKSGHIAYNFKAISVDYYLLKLERQK